MRKEYMKPILVCEKFAADEYVSACWYGKCNLSGEVYFDSNKNGQYDLDVDKWQYTNRACGHQFSITGVDNGIDNASDLANAFVVSKHTAWIPDDSFWGGHYGEVVDSATPVYYFDREHVSTIDSIKKAEDRPNHS